MSASDKIQLAIAIVAGLAAILTLWNISITNRQMRLQKEQWEFSYTPVFKVLQSESYLKKEVQMVIENSNSVFYKIMSVEFSSENVYVTWQVHGDITYTSLRNGKYNDEKFEGFRVTLTPENDEKHVGYLKLTGVDALGNDFSVRTESMTINEKELVNSNELKSTYLTKL